MKFHVLRNIQLGQIQYIQRIGPNRMVRGKLNIAQIFHGLKEMRPLYSVNILESAVMPLMPM